MKHLSNTAKEYCSESSIHGIPYLGNFEHSTFARICWLLFVSIALAATSYQVWKIWSEADANPIITTLATISYPIENIDFPAVTLCPQGSVREIVDAVLFHQFEEWLSNEAKVEGKRKKRDINQDPKKFAESNSRLKYNITMENMSLYLKKFLSDVYPGAQEKPTKLISMMTAPDPEEALGNEAILFEKEECDGTSSQNTINALAKRLGDTCPYPFQKTSDGTCLSLNQIRTTYDRADHFCKERGGGRVHHLNKYKVQDLLNDIELVKGIKKFQ